MPRINTYNLDETIRPDDLLIGSSLEGTFNGQPIYNTKNYRLSKLAEFFIGYDFNAGLSLTTLEGLVNENIVDIAALESSVSTINTSLTSLTSRVSTAEVKITQNFNSIVAVSNSVVSLGQSIQSTQQALLTKANVSDIANKSNWDAAYNEAVTGITVTENTDGSQKTITLTRRNAVDLSDGFTDIFESGSGGITDTNNYVNSSSFDVNTGVLTLGRLGLINLTASFDGRYSLLGHTHTTTDITNLASYTGFDSRYYTEAEADSLLSAKANTVHTHVTTDITNLSSYTGFDSRYVNVTGDTITGPITFNDNTQLRFGGLGDFRLYHNGTNNILHSDNGDWIFFDGTTNITTISRATGNIQIGGNTVWHAGNDGPGTGLDADTVDGKQLSNIVAEKGILTANTSMKNPTLQSGVYRVQTLTTASTGDGLQVLDAPIGAAAFGTLVNYDNDGDTFYRIYKNYQGGRMWVFSGNTSGSSQNGWYEIWNSGNDGATSGLDADLLDGQEGSYYINTSSTAQTKTGELNIGNGLKVEKSATGGQNEIARFEQNDAGVKRGVILYGAGQNGSYVGFGKSTSSPYAWRNSANTQSLMTLSDTGVLEVSNLVKLINFTSTANSERLQIEPSDYGLGKPRFLIKKNLAPNQWTIGLWDGTSSSGTIAFGVDTTQINNKFYVIGESQMDGFLTFASTKGVKGSLYNNTDQVILNNPVNSTEDRWFKGNLLGNVNDYGSASVDSVVFNPSTGTMFKDLIMGVVASTPKNIYIGGYGSGQVVGGGLYIYDNIGGTPGYRAVTGERISTWDSLSDGQITSATLNSSEELVLSRAIIPLTVSFARYGRKDQNESWGTNTITAGDFILNSDERIKENIGDYVPKRIELNYKEYNLKDDLHKNKRIGVIAQELEVDNPEFVRENEDGVKSVSYIDLLMAKVAELEERIKQLENGNTR